MKLTKSIYKDSKGNEWVFEKMSLPKKKGSYNYWIAECMSLNKAFRHEKKSELKKIIENQ
ncbi:MAG TPA: hypothetical protein VK172_10495 [Lentimicrobium sp.]|nr:hypothetical protein [Lentimicrobium sp.]